MNPNEKPQSEINDDVVLNQTQEGEILTDEDNELITITPSKQEECVLLISQNCFEIKAAYLENMQLKELFIEKKQNSSLVNNIYKAKVTKIIPGMQSAFVEIGPDQSAFLYVDDIRNYQFPDEIDEKDLVEPPSIDQDEDSIQSLSLNTNDDLGNILVASLQPKAPIQSLLQEGQELLVQVSKDPISTKGARVTTRIALAGRYLVYIPKMDQVSVSRRISQEREKDRLKKILESLLFHQIDDKKERKIEGGLIARTAAQDCDFVELEEDFLQLSSLWQKIQSDMESPQLTAPSLIYKELNLPLRVLRDLSSMQLKKIIVDSRDLQLELQHFIEKYHPDMINIKKIILDGSDDLFEKYGVDTEINRALNRKVWLPSGGYLIIDQTEALTSIDVNTGKYIGKLNFAETILNNNLEAVKEIAYQIKIRNLGGMIILDLIDMEKQEDKDRVRTALLESLAEDRIKCNVSEINDLGLIEITRKRERDSLIRTICEPCFYCQGNGYIKNAYRMTQEIYKELSIQLLSIPSVQVKLEVHPALFHSFGHDSKNLYQNILDLGQSLKKEIILVPKDTLHFEQFLYSAFIP
jgi:ribonuclease G